MVILPEEGTCYTAQPLSDDELDDLEPLGQTVCQFATNLIAPLRPGRSYRTFFGLSLAHDNAPPLAQILLCRERPLPFERMALVHLRALATRMSADLSWRLVHERLLADRDKLRDLSRIDPVLGVANRTALQEELSRRVAASERRGEPFAVAIVDVDGLRIINERHGYPAGDAVLAHVAQLARLEMRGEDIVSRYAGDSVALVLPGASGSAALTVLTRILSAIDHTPVLHEDTPINLTVSAGIAELRYDKDTGEAALARAMAARVRARLHGEVIAVADASVEVPSAGDAPAQPDFRIGTTLAGVYQIRHEISRGAFGVVYRAEDLALGRQVALKLLRPDLARDTAFVESFRAEAATLARIRNPNLVQVYAFGVDGANVFFAMELVEGVGLDARIHSARRRKRHLPIREVVGIIDQVAGALEAVHTAGMLHRDVKPENVLIDRIHRRCVLVDVGIAVRRGEKSRAGTPGFTAPEVFGDGSEAPATDVYSLAAVAYMLLTLQSPFGDASPLETLQMQAAQPPPPLTQLRRDLPPGVDAVLLPALDPDPSRRPQSARELAKALSDSLARPDSSDGWQQPRQTLEQPAVRPRVTLRSSSLRVERPSAPSFPRGAVPLGLRGAGRAPGPRVGRGHLVPVAGAGPRARPQELPAGLASDQRVHLGPARAGQGRSGVPQDRGPARARRRRLELRPVLRRRSVGRQPGPGAPHRGSVLALLPQLGCGDGRCAGHARRGDDRPRHPRSDPVRVERGAAGRRRRACRRPRGRGRAHRVHLRGRAGVRVPPDLADGDRGRPGRRGVPQLLRSWAAASAAALGSRGLQRATGSRGSRGRAG